MTNNNKKTFEEATISVVKVVANEVIHISGDDCTCATQVCVET